MAAGAPAIRTPLPFEIVPQAEMPRVINPPRGFIVTANNDPTGATLDNDSFNQRRPDGGILYFAFAYRTGACRPHLRSASRKVARRGRLTTDDLGAIQADTVMDDALVFTPDILQAFANASKPGAHPALAELAADPRVAEAVARLAAWDQSTPTGIRQGFDASDAPAAFANRAPRDRGQRRGDHLLGVAQPVLAHTFVATLTAWACRA